MNGAEKNYKFGQKNNWRRATWNEVLARTAGREKTEFILYLAGQNDLDRQIAIEKGVPPENLIAVDRCKDNLMPIKAQGGCTLHENVVNILKSWPPERPVCAVLLDFCSGMEQWNYNLHRYFFNTAFQRAVVMVNFMRGRDAWSNDLRQSLARSGLLELFLNGKIPNPQKNRALHFVILAAATLAASADEQSCCSPSQLVEENIKSKLGERILIIMAKSLTRFNTYKSGALTFDSVIFWTFSKVIDDTMRKLGMEKPYARLFGDHFDTALRPNRLIRTVRKVAAMFAVRTMRNHKTITSTSRRKS